jgi:tetratricopeptide (TPR) repeat protein
MSRACVGLGAVLLLGLSAPLRAQPASPARPPVPSGTVALAVRVDSLDAAGRWRDALPALEALARATPHDATRLAQLGRWLSWSGDHVRALDALGRAARLAPGDADVLTDYGVVLSWRPATRDSAERVLAQALAVDARHRAARVARADVLRWQGQGRAALAEYERVLALDPAYADALRGAAAVLAGWGDADGAAARLARLPDGAADLAPARVERARVAVLRNDAGTAAALLPRGDDLRVYGARALADSVDALVRPSLAVWGGARRRAGQLDDAAPSLELRVPLGTRVRATAAYAPARYDGVAGAFTVHGGGAALDADLGARMHARAALGGRTNVGTLGELALATRVSPAWRVEVSARRDPVEEFESSVRAVATPTGSVGPVRLTGGRAAVAWRAARAGADASVAVSGGVVTGSGLLDNTRRAADVQVGKSLRAGSPYVRLAYGASWLSYDYDASVAPSVAAPRTAGGYFSPDRYQYHYAQLSVSGDANRAVAWRATGAAGAQAVRAHGAAASDARGAWQGSGELLWRALPSTRVVLAAEVLDVYGAYRREGVRLGVVRGW